MALAEASESRVDAAGEPPPPTATSIDAALLSFVAAFVDTCGFIGLFGMFTAHVTGNFILVGAQLASSNEEGALIKLLTFPVFVVASMFAVIAVARLRRVGTSIVFFLLLAEAGFLFAAVVLAGVASTPAAAGDWRTLALGSLCVGAMAAQNVLMRLDLAGLPPTTVMTGNVTQVSMDIAELMAGGLSAAARARLRKMVPAIAAFALGAALGALAFAHLRFLALVAPALLCLVLARRFAK